MVQRLRVWRFEWGALVAAGLALGVGGCERQSRPSDYAALNGAIESIGTETSELTVRVDDPWAERPRSTVAALLTHDSEIYVNDRICGLDALATGDSLEMIGYRESSPRGERFVICLAYVTRPEPPPPEPDLSTPAAPATSRPKES